MIGVLVVADQLVKNWAVNVLQPVGSMDFIHFGDFKIIDLTYLENRGAIFGSMAGQRWFLVGFTSLVIIAGIVFMFATLKRSKLLNIAIGLFIVFSGSVDNNLCFKRFTDCFCVSCIFKNFIHSLTS